MERELPLVVVVSVSVCATLLILLNVVLLSYCALTRRKQIKSRSKMLSQCLETAEKSAVNSCASSTATTTSAGSSSETSDVVKVKPVVGEGKRRMGKTFLVMETASTLLYYTTLYMYALHSNSRCGDESIQ